MVSQVAVKDVYTNLSGLNAIKVAGRKDSAEGLKQVAQQFESVFVNMMLKTMRDANKAFSEGSYLSSNEMDFYQQNFDDQLSLHLTQGKGIGLADTLYRQMLQQFKVQEAADSAEVSAPDAPGTASRFSSPLEFIRALFPFAEKAADELGAKPEVLLAQSALETGWGAKIVEDSRGGNSRNLFAIKADAAWSGPVAKTGVVEFKDGVAQQQQASFRRYNSFEQSFDDYVSFLKSNPRYAKVANGGSTQDSYAQDLQDAGYATDPHYASKINQVLESKTMQFALSQLATDQP
jgi:flagellar protein FlgJ